MFEEFVRLILRGLAVVSCDRDIQVLGQHVAAQRAYLFKNVVRDNACVRALALGQGDGYRRVFGIRRLSTRPFGIGEQYIVAGFGRTILDFLHHIAQINGPADVNSDYNLLQVIGTSEKQTGFHLKFAVVAGEAAGLSAAVRTLQLADDRPGRQTVGSKPLCIEDHTDLAGLPADDRRFRDVVELLERVFQFARISPQTIGVIVLSPKRQGHDGDVVDGADLDDRLRDAGRDAIKIRVELVVGL